MVRGADTWNARLTSLPVAAVEKMQGFVDYTDAELDTLVDWGMNVIRLGFEWHLLEPEPGHFNEHYLQRMELMVRRLGERGVYVIPEMHQGQSGGQ